MANWQDKLWNWFVSTDPQWDPDRPPDIKCYVDDKEVDCFTDKIEALGYKYDVGNDWYERTWSTDSEPKESIREVYQQLENGKWNKLMIGYGDQIFYEEAVEDGSTH
tara:strand:- start:3760 stop:4080 length:321 start_codon:yes stop_codon:yes gene_type:complete